MKALDTIRETATLVALDTLQHDVPTDRAHVEVLKASIWAYGQLAPVIIRKQDKAVIDGFHRITACLELGLSHIHATSVVCDDAEFQDARIISASMHKGVSFARVTLWVREMFLASEWAQKFKPAEAFRVAGREGMFVNMAHFEKLWLKNVSSTDLYAVAQWCREKAQVWGMSAQQVANMLEIAERASPYLLPLVRERKSNREPVLTRSMLAKISQNIPDHDLQEAVAKKALAERLTEKEAVELVGAVVQAEPEQLPKVLSTSWLDTKEARRQARQHTALVSDEEHQQRADRMYEAMLLGLIAELTSRINQTPRMSTGPFSEQMEIAINDLEVAIANWRGVDSEVISILQTANKALRKSEQELTADNERLRSELASLRRTIGLGQKKYIEDTAS